MRRTIIFAQEASDVGALPLAAGITCQLYALRFSFWSLIEWSTRYVSRCHGAVSSQRIT
jgi:hypothetical protein